MTTPTLRGLLDAPGLALRLVQSFADEVLDRPVRWVHASDLADPTPFLADDLVLLTTGAQLAETGADEYVARLAGRGIAGLGFGTGVRHPSIPDGLADACADAALLLFEVPYGTPFIAVARAHAEAIAAQAFARRSWALETQRALAVAALRPHPLPAMIAELGRALGTWAGLVDAGGLSVEHPPAALSAGTRAAVAAEAAALLDRGAEAAHVVVLDGAAFQLLTIGRARRLHGVIAIAADALDAEARAVVTSVIAMAALAQEQSAQLIAERRRLHAQVLASLLTDDPALAQRVLPGLPAGPVLVAVAADPPPDALEDWWERRRAERGSRAFLADDENGVVICLPPADAPLLDEAAARFGIRIGVSNETALTTFSRAHAEARAALRRGGSGVQRFSDAAGDGILAALATADARLAAAARLAALDAADPSLAETLRAWLAHDARFEQAAAALGIHRHTLRARVAQAGRLLGLDLSAFAARAELWALLRAAQE